MLWKQFLTLLKKINLWIRNCEILVSNCYMWKQCLKSNFICITNISLLKISFSLLPLQSLQNKFTDPWASVDPRLETTATKQLNALWGPEGSFLLKTALWLCWAKEPAPSSDTGWFKYCFNLSVGLETKVQLLHLRDSKSVLHNSKWLACVWCNAACVTWSRDTHYIYRRGP